MYYLVLLMVLSSLLLVIYFDVHYSSGYLSDYEQALNIFVPYYIINGEMTRLLHKASYVP